MGRLFLIGGVTYALGSTFRAMFVAPGVCGFIGFLMLVVYAFDAPFNAVVQSGFAMVLIFLLVGIVGNLLGGCVTLGVAMMIPLALVGYVDMLLMNADYFKPSAAEMFATEMSRGCEYSKETYSKKDGYCHWKPFEACNMNDGCVTTHWVYDVSVPHHRWGPSEGTPLPGALDNIARLKDANAANKSFWTSLIPSGWELLWCLSLFAAGLVKIMFFPPKAGSEPAPVSAPRKRGANGRFI